MNTDLLYELIKICLTEGIMIALPIVLTALIVGTLVSLLQSITSIQEQTLTFVPKLIACAVCFWLLAPWMFNRLGNLLLLMMQKAGDIRF